MPPMRIGGPPPAATTFLEESGRLREPAVLTQASLEAGAWPLTEALTAAVVAAITPLVRVAVQAAIVAVLEPQENEDRHQWLRDTLVESAINSLPEDAGRPEA